MNSPRLAKFVAALAILRRCIGEKGVWADPTRYRWQCWTRDLGIAIAQLLLALGEYEIVRTHLENMVARQRPDGKIPILFLDDEAGFVADKEKRERETGHPSFMLTRYRAGEVENLTPGTKDSEIIFLVTMYEYVMATGDHEFLRRHEVQVRAAHAYIEANLKRDGLVIGCDWRDTMEKQLGDLALLTNNSLYYRALRLMGDMDAADALCERILEVHGARPAFLDYPGNERFDPLGASFAILHGLVSPERYPAFEEAFRGVDTPHGVTIKCRHNPISAEEREVIERTDGVVVWPFVVGFTSLALRHMGRTQFADEQLDKMVALDGFREWYDPASGKGYGAQEQLWSATLLARALLAAMPNALFA